MSKLIWVIVVYLVTIISVGVIFYHQQPNLEQADRGALIELALNDAVKGLPQDNSTRDLIPLSTQNLTGITVSRSIQGVTIRVLTQEEIDARSRVKPVDYLFFWGIVKSHPDSAEVSLSYFLFYRADDPGMNGDYGGKTYNCAKLSGVWVISSASGWVP